MLGDAGMDDKRGARLEPLSPGRIAALLIAILVLVVVVVSASRPGETGPAGPPSSAETGAAVVRALVVLFAIGELGVLGLVIYALWPSGPRRRLRSRSGAVALAVASYLQAAGALVLFWYYLHYRSTVPGARTGLFAIFGRAALPSIPDGRSSAGPGQEWLTAVIVVAVLAVASGFVLRGLRFGKRRTPLAKLAEELQEAFAESLAELEAEPDPRTAVIAAYARMEQALARVGYARARHEAALEYLDRLLTILGLSGPAARRLTELFQLAKFSHHAIDADMQRDAIRALIELRGELRARAVTAEGEVRPVPA
jgi:tetratricopeptide (TPR) repeat protein